MMLSKDNYNPLDVVKNNDMELPKNEANIQLKNHISVLAFFGKQPLKHSISALNLKELVYDRCKGFKTFQVVVILPKGAEDEANKLLKEIKSYQSLKFWHMVFLEDEAINSFYNNLLTTKPLNENLATNHVFIVDKDRNQRGRLDDRTEKEIADQKPKKTLYSYNCIQVAELKNKMAAEDMRILFTEYRQKRKGEFKDSSTRRNQNLKTTDEQKK